MIKRRLTVFGLTLAIISSLVGCGNDSLETVDVNATSTAQAAASTAATAATTTATPTTAAVTTEATEISSEVAEISTEATSASASSEGADPIAEGFTAVSQIVAPNTNLNLRTGPSTDYASAGLLAAGTKVTRFSIGDSWSQIYYNGTAYYVASQYLELVADGTRVDPANAGETIPSVTTAGNAETTAPVSTDGMGIQGDPRTVQVMDFSGWSLEDIATLDNTSVPYGYGTANRDQYNRPSGPTNYYYNLYAQYGAEFIAPCTNTIYLTMDEGYEAGYTPTILDTLKEKNVKAVFFVTKQFVTEHPELVTRMIQEGHVVGNHTCAHPSGGMPSLGLEVEYNDITWLNNYVYENWGYTMTLFRFPEGTFSVQALALINKLGMTPVFWSFAHADWNTQNQPDVATSLQNIVNQCHPGAIYLLHAVSATNTALLGDFIDQARSMGFEFGVYPSTGF